MPDPAPAVVDLFGNQPYDVPPIHWATKRGSQDVVEFMNIAIDALMTTGRWEKMVEPYGPSGRFFARPQLSIFGPTA
jgi:polar amino acid transport system substrate-binding protein